MLQTITWDGGAMKLLDQTKLPLEQIYIEIKDEKQMWHAIRDLVVRGAPAIGVAAAFGLYLGVKDYRGQELFGFYDRLNEVADYLITARPTAVNLSWAVDRMRRAAREAGRDSFGAQRPQDAIEVVKKRLLNECIEMAREDIEACKKIGEHGLKVLEKAVKRRRAQPVEILTHCNAGGLATVQYGTALAPIYVGKEQGLAFHVWSDETRPLMQGSRITAFELQANGIPVTIICDSMAASVMASGQVDAVIVGADRIAANGDVANKIGTLSLAINARHFGIPFFVAAPTSTIDMRLKSGEEIPIEERPGEEISNGLGRKTAPDNSDIYNPAFDVTPAALVSAIITEKGAVIPPYAKALSKLFADEKTVAVSAKPAKRKAKPKSSAKARSKRPARG
jgi:methylthioribose-1-phosphate isomerase